MAIASALREEPAASAASRLLPMLFSEERLQGTDTARILDFGRASADTLDLLSDFRCHLRILDAGQLLCAYTAEAAAADEVPEPATGADLAALFPELAGERFDTVLLWDSLNLLRREDLPGFFEFLGEHLHDGFLGHGFMLHKQGVRQRMRHFGFSREGQLRLVSEEPAPLHLHHRKRVAEAMAPLVIENAVLRADGRQEFLFR